MIAIDGDMRLSGTVRGSEQVSAGLGGRPVARHGWQLRIVPERRRVASSACGDHHTPWTIGDEKQTLIDFLDYLRHAVLRKADGLTADQLRRPMVPSGTSLLGLVKHLTRVEIAWFQYAFAGIDVPVPSGELTDADEPAAVVSGYRQATAVSNDILAGCDDLTKRCQRVAVAPEGMPLRWVLVHMIEETGRHAGHADILREQLDGAVGR